MNDDILPFQIGSLYKFNDDKWALFVGESWIYDDLEDPNRLEKHSIGKDLINNGDLILLLDQKWIKAYTSNFIALKLLLGMKIYVFYFGLSIGKSAIVDRIKEKFVLVK